MTKKPPEQSQGKGLSIFEKYLTVWVILCIVGGIAPCTAMVLVWGYLAKGNDGHTLVMVAINSLTMLFGLSSGAALATVVGVLIEVPVMLMLVKICRKTQRWFPDDAVGGIASPATAEV